ncbi:CAP domain-containing protein [Nonomuraea sp. NPDC050691]|uniref:CAP domain-containing protein n=1 Tax=Nonomuraea sp. NPDC050691 TaxID=3155661 RepID=UPI0033F7E9EC
MRRPLGVLAGLVSVAALSAPVATAHAESVSLAACRLTVNEPTLSTAGRIQASAVRQDCARPGLVRVRILRAVPGDDRVVKSAAARGRVSRVTVAMACVPGTYYTTATDYRGNAGKSKAVKLTCSPTATASPSPTSSSTATSTATPTSSPSGTPTKPTATATPKPTRTATPTPTRTVTPRPTPTSTSTSGTVGSAEENEVVRLTNAERAKGGCQPLKHDPQLRKAAFDHSADMAAQNYFSHTSKDGRSFMDRIRGAGFTGGSGWAENIAMGQPTPASVVEAWMNSSGHKANIMNCKYTLIGVGAAKNSKGQIYWTQDFAAR